MWRHTLTSLAILLSTVRVSAGAEPSVDALLDVVASPRAIPFADRQAARDALIDRPYNDVLPKLAVRITQAPRAWSARIDRSGTGSGLSDAKSPPGEQAIWALGQIWHAHTYGPKPPTFGPDLVRYLDDDAFRPMRGELVDEISAYWCAESGPAVARVFADEKEPPHVRFRAAYALMNHARDKNIDALLDFVQAHPGREANLFVRNLLTANFPRFTDRPADSRLLVIAHDLMEQEVLESGRTSGGYFMASSMGNFIATRDAPPDARNLPSVFVPRPDDPGMKRPDGNLSDAFFETPVVKAREWWEKNGPAVRGNATRPAR